jgi:hypothetical protein
MPDISRPRVASLMLLLCSAACHTDRATSERRMIEVRADRGWQDAGVTVDGKSPFTLRYVSGEVRERDTTLRNASGSDSVCGGEDCCEPMPRARRGALVGRIGRDVFDVSGGGRFMQSAKGALFLRINDCDARLRDNQGTLTVEFVPEVGAATAY